MAHHAIRPDHILAVALVLKNTDGSVTIVGSRKAQRGSVTMEQGTAINSRFGTCDLPPRFTLEAETSDLWISHTVAEAGPVALPRRGIYLPDLSFRALPTPAEDPDG